MGPEKTSQGKIAERNLEEPIGSSSFSLVSLAHTEDIVNKSKALVSFPVKPACKREEI